MLPTPPPSSIHVGVAGWSYPDWRGTFYPASSPRERDLPLVARLFDCVEINSPFYRTPAPRMAEGWLEAVRERPDFRFTSKVEKRLTHEEGLSPELLRAGAAQLLGGLRPLIDAGRLECFLLQFPFYFADSPASRERIGRLVEALQPVPCVVEVRHRSFLFGDGGGGRSGRPPPLATGPLATGPGSAIEFLERLGAGLASIDLPPGPGAVPPASINTSPLGYVRFHGRNSSAWYARGSGRDAKYDYRYSTTELEEWLKRILRLAARTERCYVIFNNHFRGQAPANAVELLHLLGRSPGDLPAELVAAHPGLERIARAGAQARAEARAEDGAQARTGVPERGGGP